MKKIRISVLVLAALLLCNLAVTAQTAKMTPLETAAMAYFADFPGSRIIPASNVFKAMDAKEKFFLLDIRSAADYAKGHLKGAVNAPFGPAVTAALAWLPEDMPVYVNCYTGQTAGQTIAVLNVAGINAQSIQYGWNLGISKTEGYEARVTTTATPAPEKTGMKIDPSIMAGVDAFFKAIPTKGNNIWGSDKIKAALDAKQDLPVVSVQQAKDYDAGHVAGSINIPFVKGMQTGFAQLPKNKTFVVHCYSGQTAGQVVGILRLLGYDAVSMKSGMGTPVTVPSGWVNEGFPVVK